MSCHRSGCVNETVGNGGHAIRNASEIQDNGSSTEWQFRKNNTTPFICKVKRLDDSEKVFHHAAFWIAVLKRRFYLRMACGSACAGQSNIPVLLLIRIEQCTLQPVFEA